MKLYQLLEYNLSQRQKDNALNNKATIIIKLHPKVFLSLTSDANSMADIEQRKQSKEFYQDLIDKEQIIVHPFIMVNEKTGKIVGHEGRARALAALYAGDRWYEISVEVTPHSRQLSYNDVPSIWKSQYTGKEFHFKDLVEAGQILVLNDNVQKQYQRVDEKEGSNLLKWFGNSKVIDSNGNPLKVYHGTNKDITKFDRTGIISKRPIYENEYYHGSDANFESFDLKYLGKKTDDGIWGSGFYFTNHIPTAKGYGKILYNVHLDIKNPLRLANFQTTNELATYLDIDESILSKRDRAIGCKLPYSGTLTSAIKDKGHDGVIVDQGGHEEIVVFSPSQIKNMKKLTEDAESGTNVLKAWFNSKTNQLYMLEQGEHHCQWLRDQAEDIDFTKIYGLSSEEYDNQYEIFNDTTPPKYDQELIEPFLKAGWVRLGYDYDTGKHNEESAFYAFGSNIRVIGKALNRFYKVVYDKLPYVNDKLIFDTIDNDMRSKKAVIGQQFYSVMKFGVIKRDLVSESWQRLSGDKTKIQTKYPNIILELEIRDTHADEIFGGIFAYDKDAPFEYNSRLGSKYKKQVGFLGWSHFQDKIKIGIVEVEQDYKRQRIALAMLSRLQKEFPNAEIDFEHIISDEGQALMEQANPLDYKIKITQNGYYTDIKVIHNDESIGSANIYKDKWGKFNALNVEYIGINKDYRKQGIATLLLKKIKQKDASGNDVVTAEVLSQAAYKAFKAVFGQPLYISSDFKEHKESDINSILPVETSENEGGEVYGSPNDRLFMVFALRNRMELQLELKNKD